MLVASILSMLLPGAGQIYVGARRRGVVLLGLTAVALLVLLALAGWAPLSVDRTLVAAVLVADLALLALRLFAVLDVWRGGVAGLVLLAALTAAPHVAAGWVTVRSYDVLESVFADEEPTDVLHQGLFASSSIPLPRWVASDGWDVALVEQLGPGEVAPLEQRTLAAQVSSKPWTTIMLLGTDEGPGNWGARTDTIILAALQHGTGRAAAFGVPRNLAQVPAGPKGKPFREPLNALYGRGWCERGQAGRLTCLAFGSTTTPSSTSAASPISSTHSAASRST